MRILVLTDDRWHPARVPRSGLQPLEKTFELDWIENANDWSRARMDACQVTILTKSNSISAQDDTPWMTPEIEATFRDYVRSGHGLLVIHSGSAGYQNNPILRALVGGVFDHHPEQCPVEVLPKAGHVLTQGVSAFTEKDEHYFMQVDSPALDIFLHSQSTNGVQPAGWLRMEGAGRVCLLTPGHNVAVWLQPSFQSLLKNAIYWCSGENI